MWAYYATLLSFIRPSVPFTLSSQLLLNPLGDFDKTWYKGSSQYVDVHIWIWISNPQDSQLS
jgi:hypothetical protein